MFVRRLTAASTILALATTLVLACGPFFPWQLLDNRNETLKATPKNSFAYEAMHLVPPPRDKFQTVEFPYDPYAENDVRKDAFSKLETAGLSSDQAAMVQKMRAAQDSLHALIGGEQLPRAVRQYTAGAIDFRSGNLGAALQRFRMVLGMPADEAGPRAMWAAFSIGRIDRLMGDGDGALDAFRTVRRSVAAGAQDPFGFAVASLGEEARIHFDRATAQLVGSPKFPAPANKDAGSPGEGAPQTPKERETIFPGYALPSQSVGVYAQEMQMAARLYAVQAAHRSDIGVQSLRIVAQNILNAPERIDATIADPLLERLLVAYVLARLDDQVPQQSNSDNREEAPDAGIRAAGVTVNPMLPNLIGAIESKGLTRPAGADRLAALAYRVGRYDLARAMAAQGHGPLAEWIEAKLALQQGDLASAAGHYAAASRGFPKLGESLEADSATRLIGEGGTLALARGQYAEALDRLLPVGATYWGDVAHIAERVLTVDELKSYVDSMPAEGSTAHCIGDDGFWSTSVEPRVELRDLLARRLMRGGRFDEAMAYFCRDKTRQSAQSYADALSGSNSYWGRVDRAEAMFKAAALSRYAGMEIMGTEAGPDYAYLGGSFDGGIGQVDPKGVFVTTGERDRFAVSKASPDLRYHYRYVAVDEALRAADLVPARSQAFAAILCKAASWMLSTPDAEKRAWPIYRLYASKGAHVAWAKHFGTKCPAPDFEGAIYLERIGPLRQARHFISSHRWWFLGGGAGASLALVTVLVIFRKRLQTLVRR